MRGVRSPFVRGGCEFCQEVSRSRLSKIMQQTRGEVRSSHSPQVQSVALVVTGYCQALPWPGALREETKSGYCMTSLVDSRMRQGILNALHEPSCQPFSPATGDAFPF